MKELLYRSEAVSAVRLGDFSVLMKKDKHIMIMCGMSAAFTALFGTPMAAAVFSIEVVSVGIMHYSASGPMCDLCLDGKGNSFLFWH